MSQDCVQFQCIDWIQLDIDDQFQVLVFGRTEEGQSVSCQLTGFRPYFYIQKKNNQPLYQADYNQLGLDRQQFQQVEKIDFYGFTDKKKQKYTQIFCTSLKQRNQTMRKLKGNYKFFESNIEPFLRLIHERDLQTSGWVQINKKDISTNNLIRTTAQIQLKIDYTKIHQIKKVQLSPIKVISMDIECRPLDGTSFPSAQSNYRYLATRLCKNSSNLDQCQDIVTKYLRQKNCITKADVSKIMRQVNNRLQSLEEDNQENIRLMNTTLQGCLPKQDGDPIIQIGVTSHLYGQSSNNIKKAIFCLGQAKIENNKDIQVVCFESEKELLKNWINYVIKEDPDVFTGYNIFGFDNEYIYIRCKELNIVNDLKKLNRITDYRWLSTVQDNEPHCIKIFEEKVLSSSALGSNIHRYLCMYGRVQIDLYKCIQKDHKLSSYSLNSVSEHFIQQKKDDISAQQIFEYQMIDDIHRGKIAKYCVQDCSLCNILIDFLDIINKEMAMGNVCNVPFSYIFMRGQGIKVFSLVLKQTSKNGFIVPVKTFNNNEYDDGEKYEGATVLDPKQGMYLDEIICVFDYASLYPSSMIQMNISHETLVSQKQYKDLDHVQYNKPICVKGTSEKVYTFISQAYQQGVIPIILQELLNARKQTRGLLKNETDQQKQKILDGQQLAYKITANSIYGQCGANTSQISCKPLAECTTAKGREMIQYAKTYMEQKHQCDIIYGDTDSLFLKFPQKYSQGKTQQERLQSVYKKGLEIEQEFNKTLPAPQKIEFEKMFSPLILFTKKRYIAHQYGNPTSYKVASTGTILSRRDSPVVAQELFQKVLNTLMNKGQDNQQQIINKSIQDLQQDLLTIVNGQYDLSDDFCKFKMTKVYQGDVYINNELAHVKVANRLNESEDVVQPNDRIVFYYAKKQTDKGKKKQSEKAVSLEELKQLQRENEGNIDYVGYIENTIMNPITSIYALDALNIPNMNKIITKEEYSQVIQKVQSKKENNQEKINERLQLIRENLVKRLIFVDLNIGIQKIPISELDSIRKEKSKIGSSDNETSASVSDINTVTTQMSVDDKETAQPKSKKMKKYKEPKNL